MVELPLWQYSGSVVLNGDLSLLEADLHAGKVAAAERGYEAEPETIEVNEAMLVAASQRLITAEEAEAEGIPFAPSHTQYVMTWKAEG
jgi:hypothetical protein